VIQAVGLILTAVYDAQTLACWLFLQRMPKYQETGESWVHLRMVNGEVLRLQWWPRLFKVIDTVKTDQATLTA
jgi:hypothetical protein